MWPKTEPMAAQSVGVPSAVQEHGSSQGAMKIMVSVLVVVIFCTLFYCIYCWRWRKRNGT